MDKVSYALLRTIYKRDAIPEEEFDQMSGFTPCGRINPHMNRLLSDKLVRRIPVSGEPDDAGGLINAKHLVEITLAGRAYVERRRRDGLLFWLPYGITTVIAAASLVVSLLSLLL